METVSLTTTSGRYLYGVRKFGYKSDFVKGYLTICAQLNFEKIDSYFDKFSIPTHGMIPGIGELKK